MADIKQAAKWLSEGKIVRRNSEFGDSTVRYKYDGDWFVCYDGETEFEEGMISLSDLLTDDWEIAK
jgi:hypothetical protein